MKVWVVRHGESETNKAGLWTGWVDVPLTQKGEADAALAKDLLSKVRFDKIYSSDLIRAKSTAEIAIPGCEYELTPIVREVNVGNIAGKPLGCVSESDKALISKEGYGKFDGESKDEFRERIKGFMKLLESQNYENVAVFSHAGFLRTFVDIVLGTVISRKALCCRNCAVAVFECTDGNWMLHSWINLS